MRPKGNTLLAIDREEEPPPAKSPTPMGPFFVAEKTPFPFYPYYFEKNLSPGLKKYYSQNGHLLLLKSLRVQVVSEIEHCRSLWEQFSPNRTLFDTWEFRLAFWKGYGYQPYFLLLKNGLANFGLLPLWYEKEKQRYSWFGSNWQEENHFFAKEPILVPLMLAICPLPVALGAISQQTVSWAQKFVEFQPDEPKYVLDLTTTHSLEDYLSRLKKKKRYNLRRDKRIIEAQHPQIVFNRFLDFDHLVALANERFSQKGEDSSWEDPKFLETFRQVVHLGKQAKSYQVRMISVQIGGKVVGVDLIVLFNRTYAPVKVGYDVKNFPGIGNFVNLLEIEDALSLGMKKIDFLEFSYGWKDKWFEEVPLFRYEKG